YSSVACAYLLALQVDATSGFGRGRGDADGLRAGGRQGDVELRHRDREALALLAEPLLDGHAAVGEVERHRRRAADAHLPFLLADGEARHVRLDAEGGDALGGLGPIARG